MENLTFLLANNQLIWITIGFWLASLFSGLLLIKSWKKIQYNSGNIFASIVGFTSIFVGVVFFFTTTATTDEITRNTIVLFILMMAVGVVGIVPLAGVNMGLFIGIGIFTEHWLPLIIAVILLTIGILCGRFYERRKAIKWHLT